MGGVQLPAAIHFPPGWVRKRWEVGGVRGGAVKVGRVLSR